MLSDGYAQRAIRTSSAPAPQASAALLRAVGGRRDAHLRNSHLRDVHERTDLVMFRDGRRVDRCLKVSRRHAHSEVDPVTAFNCAMRSMQIEKVANRDLDAPFRQPGRSIIGLADHRPYLTSSFHEVIAHGVTDCAGSTGD